MSRFAVLIALLVVATLVQAGPDSDSYSPRKVPLPAVESIQSERVDRNNISDHKLQLLKKQLRRDGLLSLDNQDLRSPNPMADPIDGGEDLTDAVDISGPLPISVSGTTADNAHDLDADCGSYNGAPDETFAFTAVGLDGGPIQYVDISLCASGYDTKLWVLDAAGDPVACNDDACPDYRSEITNIILADGETYFIVIGGWTFADTGPFQLDITAGTDPYACDVSDTPEPEVCGTHLNDGPAMGVPAFGSISDGETICGTLYADNLVRDEDYFQYTATAPLGEELTITSSSDFGERWKLQLLDETGTVVLSSVVGDPFGEVAIHNYLVMPGTYSISIAPDLTPAQSYGYGCGTNPADITNGNYRYKLGLDVHTPTPKDDCALAEEIFDGVNPFTLDAGVWSYSPGGLGMGIPNVFFEYTATSSGIVIISVCPDQAIDNDGSTAFNDYFMIALFKGCYGDFLGIDRNTGCFGYCDYDCAVDGPFSVSGPIVEGSTVTMEMLSRFDVNDYTGTITAYVQHVDPYNDFCVNAEDLGSGAVVDLFCTNLSTSDDGIMVHPELSGFGTSCADSDFGADAWYTWTASIDGWATISTCDPDGWDGVMEVYEGFACTNVDPRLPVACGDDDCGREGDGVMPQVEFEITPGSEWLIRLGGKDGSQGFSYMNIWESETARLRPANDRCADITSPGLLANGVEEIRYGNTTDGSNQDCLLLPPTVWEAFSIAECSDVRISYCPTESVTDPDPNRSFYSVSSVLFSACPCDAIFIEIASEVTNTECTEGYRTEYYTALYQGTYYIPILPGWNDGPFVDPSTGEYGLSITASTSGEVCTCCIGRAGDANGSGDDEPTIGDISVMIDALFIGSDMAVIPCLAEADVNRSGGVNPIASDITIGDISYLIDYLFITGPSLGLPDCL